MTGKRMDNIGIVVEDIGVAIEFVIDLPRTRRTSSDRGGVLNLAWRT